MVRQVVSIDAEAVNRMFRAGPEKMARAIRRAMPVIGQNVRSVMISYLKTRLKNPKGILTGSIRAEADDASVIVGPNATSATGFPYPVVVNDGRGEVVPKNAKYLSFVMGGRRVFAKKVKAFPGYHYVEHTAEQAPHIAYTTLDAFVREELAA